MKLFSNPPTSRLIPFVAWMLFTGASAQTPIPVSTLNAPADQPQRDFAVYNGLLYFASASNDPSGPGPDGRELYRADGSVTNTSRVRNINPAAGQGSDPAGFVVYNGKLYFAATTAANGRELWVTDGTFGGTQLVKDLNVGTAAGSPRALSVLNGKLYFAATRTGAFVDDLWVSDGTEAGTRLLSEALGIPTGTNVGSLAVAGGQLFYEVAGKDIWVTDGTAGGTRFVKGGPANPANPAGPSLFISISDFVAYGSKLVFRANALGFEDETWISDGTEAGTFALEANPGPNASFPSGHAVYNDKVYFYATVPSKTGLWVTDGTPAGTQPIRTGLSFVTNLRVAQGKLYFAGTSAGDSEPWTSDGTEAGTVRLKDIHPGGGSSSPAGFTAFDGRTYFTADDGTTGRELWASDGTEAGTQRVSSLGDVASTLAVLDNRLFFSARADFSGSPFELYRLLATDTPPPVSPAIADQTGTVGVSFFQNLLAFTGPAYLFPLGYSVAGLPPGLTFSGGAGGIVAGTPTTAGVYSVTVSATAVGGFPTGRAYYTITINPVGGSPALQLLAPTYNCVSGALTLNRSGGDGSPVAYRIVGLRDWAASPDFTVPPWQLTGVLFTLEARQSGTVVNRTFTSSCDPAGGPALQLLAPTYTCLTGAITFNTSGGDGSPIEFAAAGVKDWSTDPNGVVELGVRLDPNSQPLTLMARQSGNVVTYPFDFRATCGGARQAAPEFDGGLRVRVLGNPQAGETVDVVIDGAAGEALQLTVQDARGRVVSEQIIARASGGETRTVWLGKTAGLVLLRVKTAQQSQTVKIIRP